MTQEGPVAEAGLAALQGALLAIERWNSEGGVLGLSIEAARILLDAIQEAGSTRVAHVQQALLGSTFQGWAGPVTFDRAGQAQKNLALIRVEDGARRFVTYISP